MREEEERREEVVRARKEAERERREEEERQQQELEVDTNNKVTMSIITAVYRRKKIYHIYLRKSAEES